MSHELEGLVSGWKDDSSPPSSIIPLHTNIAPREELCLGTCGGGLGAERGLERDLLEGALILGVASPGSPDPG